MDEPWKYYAKWYKPHAKGQILYDSTYTRHKIGKFKETQSVIDIIRGWGTKEQKVIV